MPHFLIAGAGFAGSVLARELVSQSACTIDIWEEKSHIAGNCYTAEDEQTGIMVHHYGPHIFNTDKKEIWDYFNRFSELQPYVHRVKAVHNGEVYSFPINLATLIQFFNKTFTPTTAKQFFDLMTEVSSAKPSNFEEQAINFVGKELYHAFFYGYTRKQWGCEPHLLPASVMRRIPVRFNYDDNYHLHQHTGIPLKGYTHFVEKLLDHPRIHLTRNKKFDPDMSTDDYDHVFYTGPIDAFFRHEYGRFGYRSLLFEVERLAGDFQGVAQMNYCDETTPWTRITEHKYLSPWKQFDHTIITREYSTETGENDIPFYPKRLTRDKILLQKYRQKAEKLSKISFLGRLATYRYMDMHHVIAESIQFAKSFCEAIENGKKVPVFPNQESL